MADKAVSELVAATSLSDADLLLISQGGSSKKLLASALKTYTGGGTVTSVSGTGTVNGLSLSGTVTSTGNLTLSGTLNLSSPPAIGGTTPSTGKFTNLEYTGTLTGGTGVIAIGTSQIYKDASGNVGIGTSSPSDKLTVQLSRGSVSTPTATPGVSIKATANNGYGAYAVFTETGTTSWSIGKTNGVDALLFGSGDALSGLTERMRLDASGNLGLGVTPSAWGASSAKAIDMLGAGSAIRQSVYSPGITNGGGFVNNAYYDGTNWKFIYSSAFQACRFELNQGAFYWYNSNNTGGTGGSTWTPNQAMTLDASGNLLVGQTSTTDITKLALTQTTAYSSNTYNLATMKAASAAAYDQLQSTSVSTTATVILTSNLYASFMIVFGSDGTNRFIDLVLAGLGNGTMGVVSSLSVSGSPAARTYSQSSSTYRLAMASGTYAIQVRAISLNG